MRTAKKRPMMCCFLRNSQTLPYCYKVLDCNIKAFCLCVLVITISIDNVPVKQEIQQPQEHLPAEEQQSANL